ncbi:hypothetical protein ACHAPJ_012463 [Fusarium lateritium]
MSYSTNPTAMAFNEDQQRQYQSLCIVLQAVNEACKQRSDIRYSSGSSCSDASLNDLQKLLCKLAQILDNQKGGNCVTALVALKGRCGPEYVFASNLRKEPELQRVKSFLSELLTYAGNPPPEQHKNPKALQKQLFGKIVEFNFPRLEVYLKGLGSALKACIVCCECSKDPGRLDDIIQLRALRDRAQFPHDMTSSDDARKRLLTGLGKVLRDCEDLVKAIHHSKAGKIEDIFAKYIDDTDPDTSYHWYQLRHHLGRLHSLRQASEAIAKASKDWPLLFKDFTVNYISSFRPRKLAHSRTLHAEPREIITLAFPEYETSHYESDIAELRNHGLYEQIRKQEQEFPSKTQVHCEVNLHDHLMKTGKTRACDLWDGVMFIATSKPPCRLCYYYFQDGDNDFQVQPSHMNLYPKWQLPDVVDLNDRESIRNRDEVIEDILEHMQEDTLKILQNKFPQWKRNDSRTDSQNWPGSVREGADSRTPVGGYHMHGQSHIMDDDSYVDMGTESIGVAVIP